MSSPNRRIVVAGRNAAGSDDGGSPEQGTPDSGRMRDNAGARGYGGPGFRGADPAASGYGGPGGTSGGGIPGRKPERSDWTVGLLAGIGASLATWLPAVVLAVAAFVSTSGQSANNGVSWVSAARIGSDMWLLGAGGSFTWGAGANATLVAFPMIGLTLAAVIACRLTIRRTHRGSWQVWLASIIGYVLVAQVIVLGIASGLARLSALSVAWTTGVAAGVGAAWGQARLPDSFIAATWNAYAGRVPRWVAKALRGGAALAFALAAIGTLFSLFWLVAGAHRIQALVSPLHVDAVGGVVLAIFMALLVPTLSAWGIAYISGAGFAVGTGTSFTPGGIRSGLMPGWPIFGAVPDRPMPIFGAWLVIVPVAAAFIVGLILALRHYAFLDAEKTHVLPAKPVPAAPVGSADPVATVDDVISGAIGPTLAVPTGKEHPYVASLRQNLGILVRLVAASLIAALVATVVVVIVAVFASGGIGNGRLAVMGVSEWSMAGRLLPQLIGGAVVATIIVWLWRCRMPRGHDGNNF